MPVIETTTRTLYKFDELSDDAKEKARDWYREAGAGDQWWDCVYEQAVTAAKALGIELDTKNKGSSPAIYFSGFCSQGDGACFEGTWRYKKGWRSALLHEFGPGESLNTLLDIGQQLTAATSPHFYKLIAVCTHRGHYYHSGCMQVEVEHDDDRYRDIGNAEGDVTQLLRDFADWIYERLEEEDEHLNSDETVDENIVANEYMFTEDGGVA